jgi:hypothetical protein
MDWQPRRQVAVGLMTLQLPATRLQHEHAMVVMQDAPVRLAPNTVVDPAFRLV